MVEMEAVKINLEDGFSSKQKHATECAMKNTRKEKKSDTVVLLLRAGTNKSILACGTEKV